MAAVAATASSRGVKGVRREAAELLRVLGPLLQGLRLLKSKQSIQAEDEEGHSSSFAHSVLGLGLLRWSWRHPALASAPFLAAAGTVWSPSIPAPSHIALIGLQLGIGRYIACTPPP
eukprot:scaffold1934_cov217-Pinguiococcus_pyrenoidosus.AAC.1